MTAPPSFDRFARLALVGFVFRDASDGAAVADGLDIRLSDPQRTRRSVRLTPTPSGVWTSPHLPRIGSIPSGWPAAWPSGPSQPAYLVEVEDRLGRFLPARFAAELPLAFDDALRRRGRYVWPTWGVLAGGAAAPRLKPLLPAGPPAGYETDYLPLFPTAARTPPGPRAIVRAHLAYPPAVAGGDPRPAAWAAVTVAIDGEVAGLGVADGSGAVAVSFPYPALPGLTLPAPPPPGDGDSDAVPPSPPTPPPPRPEVVWQASVKVHHQELAGDPPDLAAILGQLAQPPRRALATLVPPDGGGAPPELGGQSLVLGRPLTVASDGEGGRRLSTLFLEEAA